MLQIAVGIGRGLAAAHDAGITHRDTKPANIVIVNDRPRLADFGIARAAQLRCLGPRSRRRSMRD